MMVPSVSTRSGPPAASSRNWVSRLVASRSAQRVSSKQPSGHDCGVAWPSDPHTLSIPSSHTEVSGSQVQDSVSGSHEMSQPTVRCDMPSSPHTTMLSPWQDSGSPGVQLTPPSSSLLSPSPSPGCLTEPQAAASAARMNRRRIDR